MKTNKTIRFFACLALSLGGLLIALPFYLTVISMFKTRGELAASIFALPVALDLTNLKTILGDREFFVSFGNSLVISMISLAFMAVLLPMLSYPIARRMNSSKFYKFLYFFIIVGLFIPFQVRMMPLIKMLKDMGLMGRIGVVLIYLGYSVCEGVFLYTGYLSSISGELEEAATIDGAGTAKIFFSIVYPLMGPMTATVLIKNILWTWNDFFMPTLVLNKPEYRTLPLFQYNFQYEHAIDFPLVFSTFFLSMLPIMVFYLVMQKNIIGGLMSGAVKG